jgi:hypothetical protein
MGLFTDLGNFATGAIQRDKEITKENLAIRADELKANRDLMIAMKKDKYAKDIANYDSERKKANEINRLNAEAPNMTQEAYAQQYLMTTLGTEKYKVMQQTDPETFRDMLANFGGAKDYKFTMDRKNIDNQFNTDTTIVNKGFADAIENAKGDSFLINKILKRKSNINENVNANIEEQLKAAKIIKEETVGDDIDLSKIKFKDNVKTLRTPPEDYNKVFNSVKEKASFESLNSKDNLIDFIGLAKKMNFASDMNFKFNDKDDSIEGMGDSANAFLDTYKNTYNQVLNSFDAKVLYNTNKSSTKISSVLNPQEIKNITEDILLQRENILTTGDKGITSAITKNRQVMTTLPLSVVDMNNQALINGEKINIDIFNSNNIYQKFLKDKATEIYGTNEGDEGIRNIIKVQGFIERDKNNTLQITNELKNLLTPVSVKENKNNIEENVNNIDVSNNTVSSDKVANEIKKDKPKSKLLITEEGISNGNGIMTWDLIEKTNQVNTLTSEQKAAYDKWKTKQLSKSDTTINDGADTVFSNMVNQIEDDITGKKKITSRK